MKDFILARCSIMNDGFIPCYPTLSVGEKIAMKFLTNLVGKIWQVKEGGYLGTNNAGQT